MCVNISLFVCNVTCTLHYCSFSCRVSAHGNSREGKKQIKKARSQLFSTQEHLFILSLGAYICVEWLDWLCWEWVLSKGLDGHGKRKFPVTEYSRLKIKWWRSEWRAWTSCWIAKASNSVWYLKQTLLLITHTAIYYVRLQRERRPWQHCSPVL